MEMKLKKIRKIKFEGWCLLFFIFAVAVYAVSTIAVKSWNVSLSMKIQQNEKECVQIERENSLLEVDVQELMSYERVATIAQQEGMSLNQDNIVTIVTNE